MSHKQSSHSSRRRSPSPSYSRRRREDPSGSRDRERDPSQLPESFAASRSSRPREDNKNVIQKMYEYKDQPLEMLAQGIKEGKQFKVCTRKINVVRGFLIGNLLYFDKHWNMVLKDVEENAFKPKKGKTPYLDDEDAVGVVEKFDLELGEKQIETEKPKGTKKEKDKKKKRKPSKMMAIRRCFDLLFVRGDTIVYVSQWPSPPRQDDVE